jgi:chromosome segregation ATPase
MKKILSIAAAALIALSGCNGDKLKQAEEQNGELNDSLHVALANQDSLLVLLNDITDGMNQIKDMEKILSNTSDLNAESASRKEQLRNDMAAIQQALQERRERLAQLESKLKKSQSYNGTLQRTIENLKAEIATQEATISTLRNDLAAAQIMVADLTTRVDSLNTTVANVTEERTRAEEHATAAENELNTCYYAIGTKKELKEAKIVETGFLRKTKLMAADFQQSYFTTADKRTLTTINTHAKKAKVLTNMPASSYTIEEVNGNQVVRISNSKEFWSRSNYLVIQVD